MRVHLYEGISPSPRERERWPQAVRAAVDLMLSSSQPMFTAWGHERLILGNDAFLSIFDLHRPDAVGLTLFEVWPELSGELSPIIDRALSGEPCRMSETQVAFSGPGGARETHLRLSCSPVFDDGGEIVAVFGVCEDVTSQVSQEELRESESRFREMADGLPLIVWVHDAAGEQELVNQTFCDFFGVTREEMKGGRWQMLVHPEDAVAYRNEFFDCVRDRRPFHSEVRVKRSDGQWRTLESWARPRFTASGEFRGFVGTSADITDRKAVEADLRDSKEELRQSDRRKDDYLAMLGHELRSPLAAIRNAIELVQLTGGADPRLRRAHGVLERQSGNMTRLINDLLDVSRIARGKISLERQTLDVREVLEGVLLDHRPQVLARGLVLEKDLPEEPVWVSGDHVRLAQTFSNIVGNAIKFTGAPGSVSVALERDDAQAVIRIRDTGVGIRPERLERIFEPFQQGGEEAERTTGGLGLGLALAKELVALHLGSIGARSDGRGAGAEFEIRLPLAPAPAALSQYEQVPGVPPRQILIVEDNLDAAQMLRDLLQTQGHRVAVATSGAEGLHLLRDGSVEVVLCDIGLPGMSGYELARAVRDDPSLRHMSLVALTGYGQDEDRRRARAAGFDEHLTKPVDLRALAGVLERLDDLRT